MSYYDNEITDRAVELYFRRYGENAMWPNRLHTERIGNTISIRTGSTLLAKYRVRSRGGSESLQYLR